MAFKNFFIIKHGETYSAPCPFCQKHLMKYVRDIGAMKEFRCKGCGQGLLYGGKLGHTRRVDEVAEKIMGGIIVP